MGRGTAFERRRAFPPTSARTVEPVFGAGIENERLILRVLHPEDFEAYRAMFEDPSTLLYADRGPMGPEEAWNRLLRQIGHWAMLGYGLFAVEEKASGRFVGEVGFGDFRRELGQGFDSRPEAAWTIAGWARSRGYATEAARAALLWMETRFRADRTVCLIHTGNRPSLRVAAKLGYKAAGKLRYRGYPAHLFARDAAALPFAAG
jgi:RimJ/RimL family protein N-acetyltransferase